MLNVLTVKTGKEKYMNRLFSADFYIIPDEDEADEPYPVTVHATYTTHEIVICGLDGCFGQWKVGHIVLPDHKRLIGLFSRKIIYYDPVKQTTDLHQMKRYTFETPGIRRRFALQGWGYAGGKGHQVLLSGHYDIVHQIDEEYPLDTPLDNLPF